MAQVGRVVVPLFLKGAAQFKAGADAAAGSLKRMSAGAQQVGSSLSRMGGAAAGATAAAAGLTYAVNKLAKAGGAVEQGMAGIAGVMGIKKASKEYDQLAAAAKQAGIETQFSPREAIEGLTNLATAGLNATQATQTLLPVLDLAAGSLGQLGVGQAAEAVVGTMKSYGMATTEATNVTDKLLRITQLTNFQTRDFGVALSKVAAVGGSFGQSLDDMVIGTGLIRDKNIEASIAASSLQRAVMNLAGDQKKQAAAAKAGVQVYDKQTGAMRSVLDIIMDLSTATKRMAVEDRNALAIKIFGARGIYAFTAISKVQKEVMRDGTKVTLRGAEALKYYRDEMGKAEGTAAAFKQTLLDTYEGQMTLLKGSTETLMTEIGATVTAALRPVVEGVKDFVNDLIDTFSRMSPELKKMIGKFIVFTAGFASAFAGILVTLTSIGFMITGIGTAISALSGVMTAFGAAGAASFGPVLIILGAILVILANIRLAFGRSALATEKTGKVIKKETASWKQWLLESLAGPFWIWLKIANTVIKWIAKGITKIFELSFSATLQIAEAGRALQQWRGADTSWWDAEIAKIAKARKGLREYNLDLIKESADAIKKATGGKGFVESFFEIMDPTESDALKTGISGTMKGMSWMVEDVLSGLGMDTGKDLFRLTKGLGPGMDAASQQLEKAISTMTESFDKMGESADKAAKEIKGMPDMGEKWRNWLARGGRTATDTAFIPGGPKVTGPGEGPTAELEKQAEFRRKVEEVREKKKDDMVKKVTDGLKAFAGTVAAVINIVKEFAGPKFAGALEILAGQIRDSLAPVFESLAPVVIMLAAIVQSINPILAEFARLIHNVAYELFYFARNVFAGVLRIIADIAETFGFDDFAADLQEEANGLREIGFNDAMAQAAQGAAQLGQAAEAASESLLNVPSGYKVTRARHGAIMDDFVMRPGQPAVEFSPDDTLVGVKNTSDIGGGSGVVIQNLTIAANDPSTFFRRLMEMVETDTLRGGVNLGGNWQGRP